MCFLSILPLLQDKRGIGKGNAPAVPALQSSCSPLGPGDKEIITHTTGRCSDKHKLLDGKWSCGGTADVCVAPQLIQDCQSLTALYGETEKYLIIKLHLTEVG